jgi:hypothetical protein
MSVMLAKFLPDKLTVLTAREAVVALRSAFIALEGVAPSPVCLSIHTGQAMLEAFRFKSCHNFCFSNAKASTTYDGYFSCYRCNEKLPEGWRHFIPEGEIVGGFGTPLKGAPLAVPDGHPQTRFRAFLNADEGARDHMALEKRKFPEAYEAARAGNVSGFVHGLKIRTFFTADEEPYFRGVNSLAHEFLPLCIDIDREHVIERQPAEDDRMICEALACVAPDPERYLHTEAVIAMMTSQAGIDEWILNERNAAMRESSE